MDIRTTIRNFITTNFYVPDPASLADDASLLDKGIVDSTGVLEVISFLEKEFSIQIEETEILPENLDSIAQLTAFVTKKKG
ncbi:MAG: acyl carrier protein [Polyangiaceae bacterium]